MVRKLRRLLPHNPKDEHNKMSSAANDKAEKASIGEQGRSVTTCSPGRTLAPGDGVGVFVR